MHRKHRGIALLTAIWVLTVLLILLGGFAAMTHSGALVARNYGEMAGARWAALSAVQRAEEEIALIAGQPYTALDGVQRVLEPDDEDTLGDASFQVIIEDEAGKLNVNTAPVESLALLLPEDAAAAVVDWRDEDATPEPLGAEDEYYAGLTPPYRCRNAPLPLLWELLLVRDITPGLLATPVAESGQALEDLLTVSSIDVNTDAQGQPRVNITSASESELSERCGDVLTPEQIAAIIQQRTASPFTSPADLLSVPDLPIESVARVYDRLTATDEPTRAGLVNLNTAPPEVLGALPGMDAATVQLICEFRDTNGPFMDVGQLLLVPGINREVLTRTADLFTTRSRHFRVRATGTSRDGISATIVCVLQVEGESANPTTRTLYWRE